MFLSLYNSRIDGQACPTYKPGALRRVAGGPAAETSADEYEPAMPPGQYHHFAYKPSTQRSSRRFAIRLRRAPLDF